MGKKLTLLICFGASAEWNQIAVDNLTHCVPLERSFEVTRGHEPGQ